MKVYHGSNEHKAVLLAGTFVTKYFKDACKFGYRRAVESGAPTVFVHTAEVQAKDLKRDIARDGAFILKNMAFADEVQEYPTFETPHKLIKFKMEVEQ